MYYIILYVCVYIYIVSTCKHPTQPKFTVLIFAINVFAKALGMRPKMGLDVCLRARIHQLIPGISGHGDGDGWHFMADKQKNIS